MEVDEVRLGLLYRPAAEGLGQTTIGDAMVVLDSNVGIGVLKGAEWLLRRWRVVDRASRVVGVDDGMSSPEEESDCRSETELGSASEEERGAREVARVVEGGSAVMMTVMRWSLTRTTVVGMGWVTVVVPAITVTV